MVAPSGRNPVQRNNRKQQNTLARSFWNNGVVCRLQLRLAILLGLAIITLGGADTISLLEARMQTIRVAQAETTNLSRTLADQAHGIFQLLDLMLAGFREGVELKFPIDPAEQQRLQHFVSMRQGSLAMVQSLAVIDSDGRELAAAPGAVAPRAPAAWQAILLDHLRDPNLALSVSRPLRDPARGAWMIPVSERIDRPDGSFAGIVIATVPVAYFRALYESIDTGPHGVILLARDDAVLLARAPMHPDDAGRDLSKTQLFSTMVRPGDRGNFEFVSLMDGTDRFASYTRVPGVNLLVMAGKAREDVLDEWRNTALMHALGLLLIISIVAFLARRLFQQIGEGEATQRLLRATNAALAESEARIAAANQWLQMAEQIAHVGHWHLHCAPGDERITWSDEVYRIHGVDKQHFVVDRTSALAAYDPPDRERIAQATEEAIAHGTPFELSARLCKPNGSCCHVLTRGRAERDAQGAIQSIFGVVIDVSSQKAHEDALRAAHEAAEAANAKLEAANEQLEAANQALEAMAMQDSLTGLSNRRYFDRALEAEFRRALRNRASLAMILIDVDQFKPFNDVYGHPAGDACLRAIAQIIPPLLKRPGDTVARYGGEEIAVLLPGNSEAGARIIADRIAEAVRALAVVHAGSQHGVVTISAGIEAFVPVHDQDLPDELVEHADLALYAAKRAGRDRRVCYSELEPAPNTARKLKAVPGDD